MKKQIKNIILTILVAVTASMTFSCAGATDPLLNGKPDKVQYNGKTKEEAMRSVGEINKIYKNSSVGRFANGDLFHDFDNNIGVTAVYEGNLIEYKSLDESIRKYIEEKGGVTNAIHNMYDNVAYDNSKRYVEFSSYTDISNGKVILYDINLFEGNFTEPRSDTNKWGSKHLKLSPDLEIDLVRNINIKTREKAKYKYPYAPSR